MVYKSKKSMWIGMLAIFTMILAACAPASPTISSTALPNTGATSAPAAAPTSAPTAAPTSAPAASQPVLMTANDPTLGNILTDSKGMTIYVFLKDTPGTSNCYDQCAKAWPPLLVQSGAALNAASGINAKLGTTTRKDGTQQLTVNNMPVYDFIKDKKPGDVTGQGVGGVWFVLDTSGNLVKTPLPAAPAAATPAASQAVQGSLLMVANNMALGNILTDSKGMTLYIFTKDTQGTSNCYDQCAAIWPPYTVSQGASLTTGSDITAKLATTTRKDGTLQLTVNGMPVYTFIKDKNPGDTTGQGIGGVWFVVDPTGKPNQTSIVTPTP